jgi:hypothetical protein
MQKAIANLRQDPEGAQRGDERTPATDLHEIDLHQGRPRGCDIRVDNRRERV